MSALPKLTLTEQLLRTDIGATFFTDAKDTVVGSYAVRAGVKAQTERMLAIHPGKREMIDITRVTVLERDDASSEMKARKIKTIEKTVADVKTRIRKA